MENASRLLRPVKRGRLSAPSLVTPLSNVSFIPNIRCPIFCAHALRPYPHYRFYRGKSGILVYGRDLPRCDCYKRIRRRRRHSVTVTRLSRLSLTARSASSYGKGTSIVLECQCDQDIDAATMAFQSFTSETETDHFVTGS